MNCSFHYLHQFDELMAVLRFDYCQEHLVNPIPNPEGKRNFLGPTLPPMVVPFVEHTDVL